MDLTSTSDITNSIKDTAINITPETISSNTPILESSADRSGDLNNETSKRTEILNQHEEEEQQQKSFQEVSLSQPEEENVQMTEQQQIISTTTNNNRRFSPSSDDEVPSCRICHCTESPSNGPIKLISPCHCSGSLKYVHHSCLQQWLDATNSQTCELCKHPLSITVKYKPLYKWNSLNASPGERRRLICNSVFNLVSMVCIFWSIYVLIERASLDAKIGQIDWSFYVKISVVTLGLIIGVIFLFVQLKLYFTIFMKWRQSNRIIVIRNANFTKSSTTVPHKAVDSHC